jgi:hypothetical protein
MIARNFDHDMDMVWHKAPRQQPIAVPVKMEKRVLNQRRDVRSSQPTSAQSIVELMVDALNGIGLSVQRLDHSAR